MNGISQIVTEIGNIVIKLKLKLWIIPDGGLELIWKILILKINVLKILLCEIQRMIGCYAELKIMFFLVQEIPVN